jgi:hypothetical protein
MSVKFLSVSLLKPSFGGFRSETAIWIQKLYKIAGGSEPILSSWYCIIISATGMSDVIPRDSSWAIGVFYKYKYCVPMTTPIVPALKKLLYPKLSRKPNEYIF